MPKRDGIASVSIEVVAKNSNTHFLRWKVHEDWVQQVKYYHDLRQVISCSNHANTALVIGNYLHINALFCRLLNLVKISSRLYFRFDAYRKSIKRN